LLGLATVTVVSLEIFFYFFIFAFAQSPLPCRGVTPWLQKGQIVTGLVFVPFSFLSLVLQTCLPLYLAWFSSLRAAGFVWTIFLFVQRKFTGAVFSFWAF
jgi:hypothetical protein